MPSRGPGATIVLIPLQSSPSANTTWFIRLSLACTVGSGAPIDEPSGRGPGRWCCGTGVPYTSLVRSFSVNRRSGVAVVSDWVLVSAQTVIWLNWPGATGQPSNGRQSKPDRKYSVPLLPVSKTPFGEIAGCTVPVVRPPLTWVRFALCTTGPIEPLSSAALLKA